MAHPQQGSSAHGELSLSAGWLVEEWAGALFKHLLGDDMDMKTDEALLNTQHQCVYVCVCVMKMKLC